MSLLTQSVVNAIALFLLDLMLRGVTVVTGSGEAGLIVKVLVYLVIGLLLALVMTFIKPLIKLLTLPLYVLTLGLFGLIVNALMLMLVSALTSWMGFGLEISSFGTAIIAGIILAILTALIAIPFKNRESNKARQANPVASLR